MSCVFGVKGGSRRFVVRLWDGWSPRLVCFFFPCVLPCFVSSLEERTFTSLPAETAAAFKAY